MLRPPNAEILIKLFRYESKGQTLEQRFKRDLDLRVPELQFDELQPQCAFAQ